MADAYYENIRKQINSAAGGGLEKADILWTVADAAASIIDGTTGTPFASTANSALQGIYTSVSKNLGPTPNPWFVWNGHDEADSIETSHYLRHRKGMQLGGGAVAIVGALASIGTQADVGALIQHSNATGSTAAHLIKFKAIAGSYKESKTIAGWLDVVIKMKLLKAGLRGGQLATAIVTPIPFAGATAVSITSGIIAAGVKIGIKAKFSNLCTMTAMDLHWRAFQEQAILGSKKGTGPASRILDELFIRRGLTRVFGQHNIKALIREPGGWLAIADKLMLL